MNTQIEKTARKIRKKLDQTQAIYLSEYLPALYIGTVNIESLKNKTLKVSYYIEPMLDSIEDIADILEKDNTKINKTVKLIEDVVKSGIFLSGKTELDLKIDDPDFLTLLKKLPSIDKFFSDFRLDAFDPDPDYRIQGNEYFFESLNCDNPTEEEIEKYNLYEIFGYITRCICEIENENFELLRDELMYGD